MSKSLRQQSIAAALLSLGAALGACDLGDSVGGEVAVYDRTTRELAIGELESVNGTYGTGCTNRTGSWSIAIAPEAALDHPELSVIKNDQGCVLTVTELRTTAGVLTAVPAIGLTDAYYETPSAFGEPVEFYANAKLSSSDFSDDFVLSILYSDDPSLATSNNTAEFTVVEASATAEQLEAPDYTLDVTGLAVQTDDADIVQAASGFAVLTAGLVSGQSFVVVPDSELTTYAEIDAAYLAGTPESLSPSLAAATFSLVGEDLSTAQIRNLIIANEADGVRSYQLFRISFNPAIRQ